MANGFILDDNDFGSIVVYRRRGMRSITARWKEYGLSINAPLTADKREVQKFIDDNREQIERIHTKSLSYHSGQTIQCFRHTVTIVSQTNQSNRISYRNESDGQLRLVVPDTLDLSSEDGSYTISQCLKKLMETFADETLLPYAKDVAHQLGVTPRYFEIGRGMRKLGHCTTMGVISLSYNIMFLPEPLVRFIICHELAHLSEMNHSSRFHALCDKYCDGKEQYYERELKNFSWPVNK